MTTSRGDVPPLCCNARGITPSGIVVGWTVTERMLPVGLSVGQFNDSYRPIMDGVGVCMENYAHWIHRKHGTAIVVAPEAPGYTDTTDYEVLRFRAVELPQMKPFRAGLPWIDPEFMRQLQTRHFDVVHAHCPFVSGRLAQGASKRRGIPLVATFHSKYRDDFLKVTGSPTLADVGIRYVVNFYQKATQVWAPNRATAQTLKQYGYKGAIEVIPNGTDLEAPTVEEKAKLAERGRALVNGQSRDVPMYLFVGQHRWEKNVELIIRTLGFMKKRGAQFRMVFAGTGYAERAMKRLCRSVGIAEETVFLGLVLERERLKELYAAATLLLFPSLYDNAPLVMREAAAFEVPTVLIRGASAAEGVTDRESGFLVENSVESLAAALQGAVLDHDLTSRVGQGALRDIYLHWRDVVAEVYSRYEDLLSTTSRRSVVVNRSSED